MTDPTGSTPVLLVEDNPCDADLVGLALAEAPAPGFKLTVVETLGEALRILQRAGADVVLLDLDLPDSRGDETLKRVLAVAPEVPVVVLTGLDDPDTALEAVRSGAQDYLAKGDLDAGSLAQSLRYALERRRSQGRIRLLNRLLRTLSETNQMIVRRHASEEILQEAARISVEHGGFSMACAVRRDPDTGRFAWEGTPPLDICRRCFTEAGLTPGGALGTAIATGAPVQVRVPAPAGDGEAGTCAAFPIVVGGVTEGAFGVMADDREVSQAEVSDLLRELSNDISFALQVERNEDRRRAAEVALLESERRYRTLFENSMAGVLRVTVHGEILDANEAAWRMFGAASEAELLEVPIERLYEDAETRRAYVADVRQGPVRNREMRLRRLDGTAFVALLSAALAPGEGDGAAAIEGSFIDVSELKRTEAKLRQAQKLEAVGRLAGGVAHDFNNLLQSGLGLVDLLRTRAGAPDTEVRAVEELEAVFRRGAALTQRLLLFARQKVPDPRPEDLNSIVEGLLHLLRRLLKENIEILSELAPEPLPLRGDAGQLEQVIINLSVNAADAMGEGGTLSLRTGRSDTRVWMAVEDTGIGMPEAVRERIFEPFFTTKGSAGGTGLGLPVVHGIIAEHGGAIEVESEEGRGTSIRFVLPVFEPEEAPEVASAAAESTVPQPGRGERILVVEDQELVRNLLCHSLTRLGYEVVEAESAEIARGLEGSFDVLLTDVVLTGANGPSLAFELRQRWPELHVVLMSGYAEDDVMKRIAELEPVRFLPKPFDLLSLSRVLHAALHPS